VRLVGVIFWRIAVTLLLTVIFLFSERAEPGVPPCPHRAAWSPGDAG
jgi:hypothetical protein